MHKIPIFESCPNSITTQLLSQLNCPHNLDVLKTIMEPSTLHVAVLNTLKISSETFEMTSTLMIAYPKVVVTVQLSSHLEITVHIVQTRMNFQKCFCRIPIF